MIELPDHVPNLSRVYALLTVLFTLLGAIVFRLWYLQVVKSPELSQKSDATGVKIIRRVAARGTIIDRRGRVLATSKPRFVVSLIPDDIQKNPQVLGLLAPLLKLTEAELQEVVKANKVNSFDPIPIMELDMETLSQVEEQKLDLPGVLITKDPIRYYNDHQIATHILGITRRISEEKLKQLKGQGYRGGDYVGMSGLEATYEALLRGKDGGQRVVVDAHGRMQRNLDATPPTPGHTLKLCLDRDLQQVAYDLLRLQYEGLGAVPGQHPGAAIALDPRTGGVLAMVSMPSYDLNTFSPRYATLLKDPARPLINRAVQGGYPPGSSFKLVTATAGLETGKLSRYSSDYCGGHIELNRRKFYCDQRYGHGHLGFEEAIAKSCNVFFYHAGLAIGGDSLADWAHRFGLGENTGIDLPIDRSGFIPAPALYKRKRHPWYRGDLANMAIGQGDVLATPLQLVRMVAAIANGGTLYRPHLVQEALDMTSGHPIISQRVEPEATGQIGFSEEHRQAIIAGMRKVMEKGGTGNGLAIPGIDIAAKTGTAEAIVKGKKVDNSVFVCFAPVEDPKIAIAVVVESGGHGATTAGPIAREMLKQYFGLRHKASPPVKVASR